MGGFPFLVNVENLRRQEKQKREYFLITQTRQDNAGSSYSTPSLDYRPEIFRSKRKR
jgi:hypothetical protein